MAKRNAECELSSNVAEMWDMQRRVFQHRGIIFTFHDTQNVLRYEQDQQLQRSGYVIHYIITFYGD